MSREIRRVPKTWQHPVEWVDVPVWSGDVPSRPEMRYRPMFPHEKYAEHLADYHADRLTYPEDIDEEPPDPTRYAPDFSEVPEEEMGYCLYETTSEGTPKTPVFDTVEEVARWAADHHVTSFASRTATYEEWLTALTGPSWGLSAVYTPATGIISGVEAQSRDL